MLTYTATMSQSSALSRNQRLFMAAIDLVALQTGHGSWVWCKTTRPAAVNKPLCSRIILCRSRHNLGIRITSVGAFLIDLHHSVSINSFFCHIGGVNLLMDALWLFFKRSAAFRASSQLHGHSWRQLAVHKGELGLQGDAVLVMGAVGSKVSVWGMDGYGAQAGLSQSSAQP